MFDLDYRSSKAKGFPLRLFLTLFFPMALLILGGAWYVGNERVQEEMAMLQSSEIGNVVMGVRRLDDELHLPLLHLRSLAQEPVVREFGESGGSRDLADMERVFQRLLEYNDGYDKVRWIDADGQERARVNYVDGKALVVGREGLQSRTDAYYFMEARGLKPGEVYISRLDLNVEHGQVEKPYKPVLRLSMPIHGNDGRVRGVLVLNIAAQSLLDAFTNSLMEARDHAMLLNNEGYWLRHPDSSLEWGFMFDRAETLAAHYPEAWKTISGMPSGQVEMADGLWTWSTAYPLKVDDSRDTTNIPYWLVVTHLQREQLDLFVHNAWKTVGSYTAGLLVLYGLLAGWLATAVLGRGRALAEAAKAHAEAEAAYQLQLAQERFRLVVEANTNGLLVVDRQGRVVLVNPALSQMFGYGAEELMGQPLETLLPEPARAHHGQFFEAYMRQPTARPMGQGRELQGRRKDGSEFPIEISLSPFTENGEMFVDAFVADITERKRSEQLHHKIEARLRLMMQTNPNGLLVVDEQGAIEMANPALEKMFGYGPGELLNQSVERLLPKELRHHHVQQRGEYLRQPSIRPMGQGKNLEGVRKDGSVFPMRISLACFVENGQTYVQATVEDLSHALDEPGERETLIA